MQLKKMNHKQIAYSKSKAAASRMKLYRNFMFALLGIFACVIAGVALAVSPVNWDAIVTLTTGGGIMYATMATIGNMPEISDKLSSPNQIGMKVWIVALDQVDQDQNFPTPNSDREVGTIPLIAGEVMHYFDAIPDTIDETATATKGEIITEYLKNFIFIVAGNRDQHLNYMEDYAGKGFIIIYQIGEDGTKYIVGSAYKPMVLQTIDRKGGGKEGRYITFTFQNKYWRQPLIYVGAIVTAAPDTVAAGATTLPITSASQYRLSDHSAQVTLAAVSGIGSDDIGRVIELLAPETASNAPDIDDSNIFILKSGTTWTANPGSRISFKIFDSTTLVEVNGTRVQTT